MSTPRKVRKLILIYDADSGRVNAWIDSARKVLQVGGCSLCSITHGLRSEREEWKDCREELGVAVDTLHRDEIFGPLKELVGGQLPCVVAETAKGLEILLTPDVLERCKGSVGDFAGRTHAAMRDLELVASTAEEI